MKSLLIWGAGDQGTVTLDCALTMKQYDKIDFLDFANKGHREIANRLIYEEKKVCVSELLLIYDEVIVATGDNELREKKIAFLRSLQVPLATIVHPTAVISAFARLAEGSTVLANAVIHTNASIGSGCIVNTAAIVEHDCQVGDFVNISPGVAMAGRVKIGRKSFLGIGSTILDGIEIGKKAIVGAGAVVIRNVPEYAVVAGVPAKIIRQRSW